MWGVRFGVWLWVWGLCLGLGVWFGGLGFGVWGLGFGVWGLGFGVPRAQPERAPQSGASTPPVRHDHTSQGNPPTDLDYELGFDLGFGL